MVHTCLEGNSDDSIVVEHEVQVILLFLVFSSYEVLLHTMHDLAIFRIEPTQRPSAIVSFSSSGTRFMSLNISSVSTIVGEGFVLRNFFEVSEDVLHLPIVSL